MPVLELNEIPRCAGQYFRASGVNGDIILNANPAHTPRIHPRVDGNYISPLQALLLPPPPLVTPLSFQPKPLAPALTQQGILSITRPALPHPPLPLPPT